MPVNGMSKHDFDMLQRRQMTGSDPVQTQNQTVSMPRSGGQTVQMPNNGQTVQMPAMQTVQMPQTARQSLLAKQDPPQTWYSGEYPTMREVYARAYQIGQADRAAAESILTDMQTLQKDPSSVYFNPYTQATNSAVENLRAAGVDTSREGWQDEYSWLKNYYRFGTGGSPLAPTKKSSAEEQAAYWYYQYMNDEDTTVQAENEWAALQEEVGYWAGRKDRNYSDEEILGKIDWSNYPTLRRMDEGRKSGTPVYINRGIGYSEDALYGVIWNARNGEAGGDPMAGAIHSAMGDGTGYTADPDIARKLDAGSDLYAPYSVGSTAPMDEAALYFGVDHFDAQWIEDNKWMRSSSDATVRKYYAQVVDAEDRTAKAEAEQANLDAYIEKQLSYGSDPERILKNVRSMMEGDNDAWDGCPTLLKMDDSLRTGELLGTTRALGYRWEDIEANVRLRCAEKNGNSLRDNVGKIREMLGVGRMPVEAQNSPSETPDVQNEEEPVQTETAAPAATQAPETAIPAESEAEQTVNDPMGAFRDGMPEVTDVVNTPAPQQTPTAEEQPAETPAPPTEAPAPAETEKPATEQEAKAGPAETPKSATEQEASVSHDAHVASATPTAGPAPTSTPRPPQENYESQNSKISAAGSVIADIGTEEEQAVWETASDYGFEEAVTDIGDAVENGNPDPEAAYQSALDTANQNAGRNYADAIVTISDHDEAVENRTAAVAGLEAMGLRYDEKTRGLVSINQEEKTVGSLDVPALLTAYDEEKDKSIAAPAFLRAIEGDIDAVREAFPDLKYEQGDQSLWDVYDQFGEMAGDGQTAIDMILENPTSTAAELFASRIYEGMSGLADDPLEGLDQDQLTQARRYQYAIQQSDETLGRITDEKYNAAVAARDSVYADYRYADEAYETFSGKSRHADETGYQAVQRLTGIPSTENEWPTSGVIEFASQYRNYQATDWSAASFYNDFVGLEANGRTYTYDDIASVAVGRKQQNSDEMARIKYTLDRIDTDGLRVPADWRRNLQRRYDALQADNQAADYFLLRKNADFDEKVAAFNLDEVGKDNPIYIKERGWITTAVGIVGEAFTRKAQKAQAMSGAEASTYKYLYVTEGEEAAEQYLTSLDNVLTMRIAQDDSAMYERMSTGWGWIPMNVLSIMESPLRLAGTGYSALQLFKGEEINPYANAFSANRLTAGVQAGTNTTIENSFGKGILGGAVKLAYSGGYSGFESLYGNFVFGGLGGVHIPYSGSNKILQRVVDSADEVFAAFPMGINAAGGAMQNAAFAGANNDQIFAIGITTALAESVTEAISFGNMDEARDIAAGAVAAGGRNAKSYGTAFRKWLGALPGELGSEIVGEVSNDVIEDYFDHTVMGENSEFEKTKHGYIDAGHSPDEAENLAWGDMFKGCLYTAISTIVSTAVSGAVSVGSESIQQHRENRQLTPDQLAPSATAVQAPGAMTTADLQDVLHGTQQPAFNPDDQNFIQPEETQQTATEAEETAQEEQAAPETEEAAAQTEEQTEEQAAQAPVQAPGGLTREELTEAALAPRDFTPTEESDAAAQAQLAAQAPQGAEIEQEQQATTRQAEPQGAEISQEQGTNTPKQAERSAEEAEAERAAQVADRVNQYNRRIMKFQMAMRSQTGNTPAQTATLAAFLSSQTRNSKYDETAIAAAQHLISRFGERAGDIINALGSQLRSRAERQKTGANYTEILKYAALGNGETAQVLEAAANGQINADTVNNLLAALKNDKQNPEVAAAMQEAVRTNRISRQVAKLIGLGAMDTIAPYQQAVDTARQARDTAQQRLETSQREQQAVGENLEAATGAYLENPTDQLARGQYQQAVNDVTGQAAVVQENEQSVSNAEESLQTAKGQLKDKQAEAMETVRQQATETVDQQMAQEAQDDARQRAQKGNKGTAYVGSTPIEFHYEVIDRDGLISSHSGQQLGQNPAYPAELQPRNRDTEASRSQIQGIANELVPARLGESTDVQNGAPIVGPDYVVESGNGRVAAIESSPHRAEYTAWLRENAENFGINPDSVTDNSILVRVRDTEVDRQQFVQAANESTTASYSATETAKADAQKMTDDIIDLYNPDTDLNSRANAAFINALMQRVIPQNEQNDVFDSRGRLSQNGINRIRNALFQKAFGSTTLTQALSESTNEKVRNILNALTGIAPQMAKLNQRMADNEIGSYPLAEAITRAVLDVKQARDTNTPIEAVTGQFSMLEDESTAASRAIAGFMDSNKRSGKNVQRVLSNLIDALNATVPVDPNQITMPGMDMTPRTLDQIVEDVVARTAEDIADEKSGQVKGQQSMFEEQAAPETAPEAPTYTVETKSATDKTLIATTAEGETRYPLLYSAAQFDRIKREETGISGIVSDGNGNRYVLYESGIAAPYNLAYKYNTANVKTWERNNGDDGISRMAATPSSPSNQLAPSTGSARQRLESGYRILENITQTLGMRNEPRMKKYLRSLRKTTAGYTMNNGVIHVKNAQDVLSGMHEIVHNLDKRLGMQSMVTNMSAMIGRYNTMYGAGFLSSYKPSQIPGEVMAEFGKVWLKDRSEAIQLGGKDFVDKFEAALRERGWLVPLQQAATQTRLLLTASGVDRVKAQTDLELPQKQGGFSFRQLRTDYADYTLPMQDITNAIDSAKGKKTEADHDTRAFMLQKPTIISNFTKACVFDGRSDMVDPTGETIYYADGRAVPSLQKISDTYNLQESDEADLNALALAYRQLDALNFAARKKDEIKAQTGKDVDVPVKNVMDPTINPQQVIREIENSKPHVKNAYHEMIAAYDAFFRTWMVDTGIKSEAEYQAMHEAVPHYMPALATDTVARKKAGNGATRRLDRDQRAGVTRRASGHTSNTYNPVVSLFETMQNQIAAYRNIEMSRAFHEQMTEAMANGLDISAIAEPAQVSMKQTNSGNAIDQAESVVSRVGTKLVQAGTMDQMSLDAILDAVTSLPTQGWIAQNAQGEDVVNIPLADGSIASWTVYDQNVITALAMQPKGTQSRILRALSALKNFFSFNVTSRNVKFSMQNLMSDTETAMNTTNAKFWEGLAPVFIARQAGSAVELLRNKLAETALGEKLGVTTTEAYDLFKLFGQTGNKYSFRQEKTQEESREGFYHHKKNAGEIAKMIVKSPITGIEAVSDFGESVTRFNDFKHSGADLSTYAGRMQAGRNSREGSTDFTKTGARNDDLKTLKAVKAFLGAQIQGIDKTISLFSKDTSPQQRAKVLGRIAINGLLTNFAMAALRGATWDDDEKEAYNQLSAYERTKYWHIKNEDGSYTRIKRSQDAFIQAVDMVGEVLGNIVTGNGGSALDDLFNYGKEIASQAVIGTDNIFSPFIDAGNNKTWYGGSIDSYSMQQKSPTERYTEETPIWARGISTIIGGKYSPQQVEYITQQMFGSLGTIGTSVIQTAQGIGGMVSGDGTNVGDLVRIWTEPVAKAFSVDPTYSNDISSTFYDGKTGLDQMLSEIKSGHAPGAFRYDLSQEEADAAYAELKDMTGKDGVITEIHNTVSTLWDEIDTVLADETLTEDMKDAETRRIRGEINEECLLGNAYMADFRDRYCYGNGASQAVMNTLNLMTGAKRTPTVLNDWQKMPEMFRNDEGEDYMVYAREVYEREGTASSLPHPSYTFSDKKISYTVTEDKMDDFNKDYRDAYMGYIYDRVGPGMQYETWASVPEGMQKEILKGAHTAAQAAAKKSYIAYYKDTH